MRPPSILTLQLLNVLIGAGMYLGFATATGTFIHSGWSPWMIGLAMTAANLCYAGLVVQGGRLSDRWGRARTAILGASICVLGSLVAVVADAAWSAVAATMLGCAGAAFFYPGNVGLFSDARSPDGASALPLHVKVSRYNLGWSGGNIIGFGLAWAFALLPTRVGWATIMVGATTALVTLWRWRALPAHPPRADGDRAPHPALPRMIWMGRAALLVYCLLGMAFISLLARAIADAGGCSGGAQARATSALFAYAIGYFLAFVLFGNWDGWVMRPWRLLAMQAPVMLAACGIVWMSSTGVAGMAVLAGLGFLLGAGFGAVYTGSIYYSLRLPEGAARAAALHETAVGVGSTAGPLACGVFMGVCGDGALGSLGMWMVLIAAVVLSLQALLIPGAIRLGAR